MMISLSYLILSLSTIFNAVVSAVVGVFVYMKNKTSSIHRTFAIFCFFMFLWAAFYFWPFVSHSESLSLLSFKLEHIGAIFIAVAHFHFICALLGIEEKNNKIIQYGYLFNLFFLFLLPGDLYISAVSIHSPLTYYVDLGPLYHIWLFVWIGYIFYSLYLLFTSYKTAEGIQKQKIKYVLIGDGVTFFFGSTNFLLAYGIPLPPYFNILSSAQILMILYIIIRYRFFDMKFNILRGIKKGVTFLISAIVAYGVYYFLQQWDFEISAIVFFISLFCFYIAYLFFREFIETPFFLNLFKFTLNYHHIDDYKNVIEHFISTSTLYTTISNLKNDIEKIFCNTLQIQNAQIVVLKKNQYECLTHYFQENKEFLVTKEIVFQFQGKSKPCFLKELEHLGEICFPLYQSSGKLFAFFVLGKKPFDDLYLKDELSLLERASRYIELNLINILYSSELKKEIAQKTEHLREQNNEIQAILQQQADFIAITAHEFRTPLSIALFQVDESLYMHKENKDVITDIKAIESSLQDLKDLTKKLFTVQQYDLEKIELQKESVYVFSFALQIQKGFEKIMEEKSISFVFQNLVEKDVEISLDPSQVRQVMHNILTNAQKFTPKNGEVKMRVEKQEKNLLFSIENSGKNIPQEDKDRIFEKFQTKKATSAMGIGLGLYICKKIIDLHGGKIWVENPKSGRQGAVFFVELPL